MLDGLVAAFVGWSPPDGRRASRAGRDHRRHSQGADPV